MCRFEHLRFDECGHRVIKLSQFCAERKWMAGMNGSLLPCAEFWYTPAVLEGSKRFDGRWRWIGMKGFCVGCEKEFLTSTTRFPMRSYNDTIFYQSSILSEDWIEPFIHLPEIRKSVPELVGLSHQYRYSHADSPREEGPEIRFKEKFQIYEKELPLNRMQWLRGDPSIDAGPDDIQGDIYKMCGFSKMDIEKIATAIGLQYKGSTVYEREFKRRGMPKAVFDHFTSRILAGYKNIHANPRKKWVDNWNS